MPIKHVRIAIIHGAAISRVARVAWITDVSKIAHAFVDNHVFVQLPNISAGELVDVRAVELARSGSLASRKRTVL
jgi:hypothetical protein